jgi:hypothetical protein
MTDKQSDPYVIHVGTGVDDRLKECQNELHRLRSARDSATTEGEHHLLLMTYMDALQSFTHSLISMVTNSGMGDCSIVIDVYGNEHSFEWSKGGTYNGGMIRRGNEWSIHT